MYQSAKEMAYKAKQRAVSVIDNATGAVVATVGTAMTVGSQMANAAADLPASVATSVTQISDNGHAIFDLVFPVVATFLGLVIVIKLFKRFGNKI